MSNYVFKYMYRKIYKFKLIKTHRYNNDNRIITEKTTEECCFKVNVHIIVII